ncbi:ebp domain containing protein [Niveomyces insectorum RCEF 264]|uniref:Ebp domain containing protein n=1 Tax=Niveomyces insectorum RCEF 264 TaxID=1081102 RepID=A0A167ZWX1_9HYPO|nr:ebp domain containing protein [Niveomyces insectorum RCEF 264]
MPHEQVFTGAGHPYYPPFAVIPNYAPNITPLPVLFASFCLVLGIVLTTAALLAGRARPSFRDASLSDRALFLWFVLCGSLHCGFEGYFVLHHATLAGAQSLPAQLWKEYALSDSRYLTSDPFTLCVETLTVVAWGPLCWAAAVAIVRDASCHRGGSGGDGGGSAGDGRNVGAKSGLRVALQMLASFAHLYGVALYYGTAGADLLLRGTAHCRPEFVYVWVYFVGMNAPWVVVPAVVLYSSVQHIRRVFAALDRVDATLHASSSLQATMEPKKRR